MSWNIQPLLEDAMAAASRAVTFDSASQFGPACYFYREATRLLNLVASSGTDPATLEAWLQKGRDYSARADAIEKLGNIFY
jgi:hypothetical protein